MQGIMFKPWKSKLIRDNPGREWVTRRVIKFPQFSNIKDPDWHAPWFDSNLGKWIFSARFGLAAKDAWIKSRYPVGSVVYIKEAWATEKQFDNKPPSFLGDAATVALWWKHDDDQLDNLEQERGRWRSPLHLPSWLARFFIKILGVDACRTRDITFEDCLAEGIVDSPQWQALDYKPPEPLHPGNLSNEEADKETDRGWVEYARQAYFMLYDSINGKGAHEKNWDFRYSFILVPRPLR